MTYWSIGSQPYSSVPHSIQQAPNVDSVFFSAICAASNFSTTTLMTSPSRHFPDQGVQLNTTIALFPTGSSRPQMFITAVLIASLEEHETVTSEWHIVSNQVSFLSLPFCSVNYHRRSRVGKTYLFISASLELAQALTNTNANR